MHRAVRGWTFVAATLIAFAPCGFGPAPFGLAGAKAASADRPKAIGAKKRKATKTRPAVDRAGAAKATPRIAIAAGFAPAERFAYTAAFSASMHPGETISFQTVINPLRSQEFPATPEYSYLYVSSPVLGTAPAATPYSYIADNRALLSPSTSARAIIDAYSWRRTWLNPRSATANGLNARTLRPPVGRAPNDEIADSLKPNGTGGASASSELNSALRSLRLPAR